MPTPVVWTKAEGITTGRQAITTIIVTLPRAVVPAVLFKGLKYPIQPGTIASGIIFKLQTRG